MTFCDKNLQWHFVIRVYNDQYTIFSVKSSMTSSIQLINFAYYSYAKSTSM